MHRFDLLRLFEICLCKIVFTVLAHDFYIHPRNEHGLETQQMVLPVAATPG